MLRKTLIALAGAVAIGAEVRKIASAPLIKARGIVLSSCLHAIAKAVCRDHPADVGQGQVAG